MPLAAIKLTPDAQHDIEDIWFSIAREDVRAADRMIELIYERADQLASFPMSGPARPEINTDTRSLVLGSYVILYRVIALEVEVIRVVHGARDITDLLQVKKP